MPHKIAIFASGSGSNAENIIRCFRDSQEFEFPVIISNKSDAYVHVRAEELGIRSITFSRDDFSTGEIILDLLTELQVDYIVLAGFLLKFPDLLVSTYSQRIINIHPSLLPKFGGKGMYGMRVHEAVLAAGEAETGITIHYIDENYDEGDVIFQAKCPVLDGDTADMVAQRVHALEYEHYPRIIADLWSARP